MSFTLRMGLEGSSAQSWRTMAGRMLNSQLTLNSCGICCSSWILMYLCDFMMGFIQEYSKSWLMSVRGLSQLFVNSLWYLWSSQLTGSCLRLSQCSRSARRMTLETTGLSVSLQCLIKLWRWFWSYSRGKTPEWHHSHCHNQHSFMRRKSCMSYLLGQGNPLGWSREASWCDLFGFQ